MFNRYYEDELALLKELGAEFSKAHPAVAPMLSGPTADPDVERLLEGVAFLTGLLRQKLDDEFPEIVHELVHLIFPHYLRPVPSSTIIEFTPKPTLKQPMKIPAGIHVASLPVEGTRCHFQTCYDVEVSPLTIAEASYSEPPGRPPVISLTMELRGLRLSDWQPQSLRLFLAGTYTDASNILFVLQRHLKQVIFSPDSGIPCFLTPDHVKPVGFSQDQGLIPYPSNSFPAYRILQEYFILPEKFLFLDITGWEKWEQKGEGNRFEITFELEKPPFPLSHLKKENFVLSATPAVNIFPHEADPIRLDHRKTEYQVRPSGGNFSNYQIYSVEQVVGFVQGTAQEKPYIPFEVFNPEPESGSVYHIKLRESPVRSDPNVFISVAYPGNAPLPESETLSIDLLCTNGFLPENIKTGDICVATGTTPEFVDFKNIRPPTLSLLPPIGQNLLWKLLSHLSLNYVSLAKAENLRALLDLYMFEQTRDKTAVLANRKRIQGILEVETRGTNRMVSGIMMRGREISVKVSLDNFAGMGDLYLFGCILDYFLGVYASLNTYTSLVIKEVTKGDTYQWPARTGEQPLI